MKRGIHLHEIEVRGRREHRASTICPQILFSPLFLPIGVDGEWRFITDVNVELHRVPLKYLPKGAVQKIPDAPSAHPTTSAVLPQHHGFGGKSRGRSKHLKPSSNLDGRQNGLRGSRVTLTLEQAHNSKMSQSGCSKRQNERVKDVRDASLGG